MAKPSTTKNFIENVNDEIRDLQIIIDAAKRALNNPACSNPAGVGEELASTLKRAGNVVSNLSTNLKAAK